MKTLSILLLVLFSLLSATVVAGGSKHTVLMATPFADGTETTVTPEVLAASIAPVTPAVADFEDTCDTVPVASPDELAPKTPVEADFTR